MKQTRGLISEILETELEAMNGPDQMCHKVHKVQMRSSQMTANQMITVNSCKHTYGINRPFHLLNNDVVVEGVIEIPRTGTFLLVWWDGNRYSTTDY